MWWPSFLAVLGDLWRFVWGREVTVASGVGPPVRRVERQTGSVLSDAVPAAPPVVLGVNIRYDERHPATVAVRDFLRTETALQVSTGDLTPYEWLAYVYSKQGRPLPWLALTSATLGYWHQALRGLSNCVIGVNPKTHALMEWQDDAKQGRVGYVTKVAPDETITVHELGASLPGVLIEATHTLDQWRELRPVFISLS